MKNNRIVFFMFFFALVLISCSAQSQVESPQLEQTQTPKAIVEPTITPFVKATDTQATRPTDMPIMYSGILEGIPPNLYVAYLKVDYINPPKLGLIAKDDLNYRVLFSGEFVNSTFTIAPDGQKLAYSKFVGVGKYELTVINLKTGQIKGFSIPQCVPSANSPSWSPDNTYIAISCDSHMIAVVSITDNKLIVKSYLTFDDEKATILDPAWSPNGNFLSFYISRPFDARDSSAHGPYLIDMECYKNNSECEIKPYDLGKEGIAHWTPDGFLAVVDKTQIFLFDPIAKKVEKILTIPMKDTRIESFAWSPENQWVAFSAHGYDGAPGTNAIYVMRLGGTDQPILLDGKGGGEVLFWLPIAK